MSAHAGTGLALADRARVWLRRSGIGTRLVAEAERHALAFGCHSAWLDTFSFQGPNFYPRLGYREFARLDYPPDHQRIFLKKQLIPE